MNKEFKEEQTMKKGFIYIAVALALLMSLVLPSIALAASSDSDSKTGTFTAASKAPTVDVIELYDDEACTNVVTTMDVNTEYYLKVTISDANKLRQLEKVDVYLIYCDDASNPTTDPSTGFSADTSTAVHLSYTLATTTWGISPSGAGTTWAKNDATSHPPASLSATTGSFSFAFTPGFVAHQGVSGNGAVAGWKAGAKAINQGTGSPSGYRWGFSDGNVKKGINAYRAIDSIAISGTSGNIEFGEVDPDATDSAQTNTVTPSYISNGDYKVEASTSSSWTSDATSTTLDGAYDPVTNDVTLTVHDTSAFSDGDFIMVGGANNDVATIATVDSATQLTLTVALGHAHADADGVYYRVALEGVTTPGDGEFTLKGYYDDTNLSAYQITGSLAGNIMAGTESVTEDVTGDSFADTTFWLALGSNNIPVGTYDGTITLNITTR